MEQSGNTILITGGGSGIGMALAQQFHRAGNTVVIAGRRQAALDAVAAAHPGMIARALNVADAADISVFAARVLSEHPGLNVLVNNAGIMRHEKEIDLAAAEATVTTNLLGPIRLTSALLPHLSAQPYSTVINVSSGLAFVPFIRTPTYCATKAALHSWTVSLREQLRGTNVEVIEIIPPAVQTELMPGQSQSPMAMPLDAYIAETMDLLRREPTPPEIYVERTKVLRSVVNDDLFDERLRMLNGLG